jgi:hypothetical protein
MTCSLEHAARRAIETEDRSVDNVRDWMPNPEECLLIKQRVEWAMRYFGLDALDEDARFELVKRWAR